MPTRYYTPRLSNFDATVKTEKKQGTALLDSGTEALLFCYIYKKVLTSAL